MKLAADELEAIAAIIMRVDGDRDHMNQSRLTCEQTQLLARYLRMLALEASNWHPVQPPRDTWLRTKREDEDGENVCMLPSFNEEEWIERGGQGRTTVTHHSFPAPTHWRHLEKQNP